MMGFIPGWQTDDRVNINGTLTLKTACIEHVRVQKGKESFMTTKRNNFSEGEDYNMSTFSHVWSSLIEKT